MAAARKVEDKWTEHKDEDGRTYYYNFARKQGVWEKPEGFQSETEPEAGMEVEDLPDDSSDEEDFRPALVEFCQEVKKLLSKNQFSALAEKESNKDADPSAEKTTPVVAKSGKSTGKNNNNANPAGGKPTPVVPAPGKPAGGKRQPPLVVQNTSFTRLAKVLTSCDVQPEQKLTRSGIKLTCFSSDDFEKVQAHLLKHKVPFYTHGKRCDRTHRVVIRGLPNMEPEFIKKLLKDDHQLDVLAVYAIKRRQQLPAVDETPYIVLFPKGHTSLKELNKVKKVGPVVIRWEAYRNKQPHVTQCKNCLQFGHGTSNCHLKPRCSSCGGPHSTDKCKAEEAQAAKCANCSGSHEGLDRSCPKREQFIQSRQQATKPKPPAWKKKENRSPTVPAFNVADFPPLPGGVPLVAPRPEVCNQGQPHPGGSKKHHPRPEGSNRGPQSGGAKKDEEEELYSSAELWEILTEYIRRFRSCKTRSDQYAVVCFMACKFGVK